MAEVNNELKADIKVKEIRTITLVQVIINVFLLRRLKIMNLSVFS